MQHGGPITERLIVQIAKNKVVAVDYTLTNSAGEVLDSSGGQEPLAYLHGVGGLIPGLERALEGKSAGEKLNVVVKPEDAYGARHEELVQDVPRKSFGGTKIEPGMQFRAEGPNSASRVVTVISVQPDSVKIDANHPLAGQTLNFDVTIVSVRDETAEEVSHGHAHGAGGHHHH